MPLQSRWVVQHHGAALDTTAAPVTLSHIGTFLYRQLHRKEKRIPYGDSRLTRVLRTALGGDALTSIILNLTPHPENRAETISSLVRATMAVTVVMRTSAFVLNSFSCVPHIVSAFW